MIKKFIKSLKANGIIGTLRLVFSFIKMKYT